MNSEQRTLIHLQLELEASYNELDRRAGIISHLADQLARANHKLLAPEPQPRMISRWSEQQGWHEIEDTKGTERRYPKDEAA